MKADKRLRNADIKHFSCSTELKQLLNSQQLLLTHQEKKKKHNYVQALTSVRRNSNVRLTDEYDHGQAIQLQSFVLLWSNCSLCWTFNCGECCNLNPMTNLQAVTAVFYLQSCFTNTSDRSARWPHILIYPYLMWDWLSVVEICADLTFWKIALSSLGSPRLVDCT